MLSLWMQCILQEMCNENGHRRKMQNVSRALLFNDCYQKQLSCQRLDIESRVCQCCVMYLMFTFVLEILLIQICKIY